MSCVSPSPPACAHRHAATPEAVDAAALVTVNATGAVPGGVSLDGPGADGVRIPDVSAGRTGRTVLE